MNMNAQEIIDRLSRDPRDAEAIKAAVKADKRDLPVWVRIIRADAIRGGVR